METLKRFTIRDYFLLFQWLGRYYNSHMQFFKRLADFEWTHRILEIIRATVQIKMTHLLTDFCRQQ